MSGQPASSNNASKTTRCASGYVSAVTWQQAVFLVCNLLFSCVFSCNYLSTDQPKPALQAPLCCCSFLLSDFRLFQYTSWPADIAPCTNCCGSMPVKNVSTSEKLTFYFKVIPVRDVAWRGWTEGFCKSQAPCQDLFPWSFYGVLTEQLVCQLLMRWLDGPVLFHPSSSFLSLPGDSDGLNSQPSTLPKDCHSLAFTRRLHFFKYFDLPKAISLSHSFCLSDHHALSLT